MAAMSDGVAVATKEARTEKMLVLRSCKADGSSHNGWKYPLTEGAIVEAPDWNTAPKCGGGFHGLPFGDGDQTLLCWDQDAWWQVFEVDAGDVVKIDDAKVKFRRGTQVFLRQGLAPGFPLALAYIEANRPKRKAKKGDDIASGDGSTAASSGYGSTAASSGKKTVAASIGRGGAAKAGEDGCLAVTWWDKKADRPRIAVGYVGENGIKPDTWYAADEKGKLVEPK